MTFALTSVETLANEALAAQLAHDLDDKTKPRGSLGRIETLAAQIGLIQGRARPVLESPQLVVFAADHGIASQGVSAYPAEVTRQMVGNFLAGGAAVSVLARQHGLGLTVVDCGVAHDFAPQAGLVLAKVPGCAHGTADSSHGPAMSVAEAKEAMANGGHLVRSLPGNALLLGEMGIANTSAAALLMARLTGLALSQCVGRGTGLDNAGLAHKQAVLQAALAANAGAVLQAAAERRVVVVDGFITTAAVAVAHALAPAVLQRCVFAHASAESGHAQWLRKLGVQPLLDLGLRLGEGSGAALAWPLLVSACKLLDEMASFSSAGVSREEPSAGA
jgi:nicotinate-nucleotide--dimethylbenzimidazole phosphoribosyltransferase